MKATDKRGLSPRLSETSPSPRKKDVSREATPNDRQRGDLVPVSESSTAHDADRREQEVDAYCVPWYLG